MLRKAAHALAWTVIAVLFVHEVLVSFDPGLCFINCAPQPSR
jgi:hypothetical protein